MKKLYIEVYSKKEKIKKKLRKVKKNVGNTKKAFVIILRKRKGDAIE